MLVKLELVQNILQNLTEYIQCDGVGCRFYFISPLRCVSLLVYCVCFKVEMLYSIASRKNERLNAATHAKNKSQSKPINNLQ